MSSIDLRKFVDINIKKHVTSFVTGVRDTVVLFTPEGTAGTITEFDSLADVTYAENSLTYAYLKNYFDNAGVKVRVYEATNYDTITKDTLLALDNKYICVVVAATAENKEACYVAVKNLAIAMNVDANVYGINEKILITSTNIATANLTTADYAASVPNLAVKYSSVLGAEMSIAAYLSQINTDGIDTVRDYAFTEEILSSYNQPSNSWTIQQGEDITTLQYDAIQTANMNVDIYLANAVRNCGGNCKDGSDVVNSFMKIVLHQTLTDQLINLLAQKIKNATGISKLYTVITQELERYLSCGYLTTDKIWTDNDLKITRNNSTYTIINKGDALTNGYVVRILPMSSLTDAEKTQHSAPPIYVIIADQYSIRKITINGDII